MTDPGLKSGEAANSLLNETRLTAWKASHGNPCKIVVLGRWCLADHNE